LSEKLIDADSFGLKLAPKLEHNILNVSGTERMKVASAVKLLSKHTAFLAKFVFIYLFIYLYDNSLSRARAFQLKKQVHIFALHSLSFQL